MCDGCRNDDGETLRYAQRLAVALWEKHWQREAPDWKPLDDILGVLTQIDNATAGLERRIDGTGMMTVERLDLGEANAFVLAWHRHHKPVIGHLFSLGAAKDGKIVGVAIIGRPVARLRDDGVTAEVTRLCTDGTKNACSFLYGASTRAAFALGFKRIGTYILASEPGTSLMASGWRQIGEVRGCSWDRPSRPRVDKHPTQDKFLFEMTR